MLCFSCVLPFGISFTAKGNEIDNKNPPVKGKKNTPTKDKNDFCNDDAIGFELSPGYVKSLAMKIMWHASPFLDFAELISGNFNEILEEIILH